MEDSLTLFLKTDTSGTNKPLQDVEQQMVKLKTAAKETNNEVVKGKSHVGDYFRAFRAGASAAGGSLKGLAMVMAASGVGLLIAGIAALITVLKKLEFVQNLFNGITDAIGLTTKASDKHIEKIKGISEKTIEAAKHERDLAKAMGETAEQAIINDALLQGRIIAANNAVIADLENEKKKQEALVTTGKILGLTIQLEGERAKGAAASNKKVIEIQKQIDDLNKKNALAIATITGLEKDRTLLHQKDSDKKVKDDEKAQKEITDNQIKEWKREADEGERIGQAEDAMIAENAAKARAIEDKSKKDSVEATKKQRKQIGNIIDSGNDKIEEAEKTHLDMMNDLNDTALAKGLVTQKQYDKQQRANDIAAAKLEIKDLKAQKIKVDKINAEYDQKELEDKKELNKQIIQASAEAAQEIASAVFSIKQENNDREMQRELDALDTGNRHKTAAEARLQEAQDAIKKKYWEKQKKNDISEALINTALGVTKAISQGGILGFITGALVLIAGLAQVATISNKKYYQSGGKLYGASHANGGIALGGGQEAEGGEYIVNKRSMKNPMIAAEVSRLNNMGNNGTSGSYMPLTESRVAFIAAQVIKNVPVTITEKSVTDKQKSVEVLDSRFRRN
jgi:hypothetical protein